MTDNDSRADRDGDPDDVLPHRLVDDGERWRADEPVSRELAAFLPAAARGSRPARRSGSWSRRAPWLVAAAVAVLAAGVLIPLSLNRSERQAAPPPASPACPTSLAMDADPLPAGDTVDTGDRLVPERAPTAMLICRYDPWHYGAAGDRTTAVDLDVGAAVTAGLAAVPASLRTAVRDDGEQGCWTSGTDPSAETGTTYLVALSYGERVMWVEDSTGMPGCDAARNASFGVDGTYGEQFAAALERRAWSSAQSSTELSAVPTDRPGESSSDVPNPAGITDFACPESVPAPTNSLPPPLSVPAPPSIETDGRMVPAEDPGAAIVCSYHFEMDATEASKSSGGAVRGNVSGLVEDLRWLPPGGIGEKGCTAMGGPTTVLLVGLQYSSEILWVASDLDPNDCSGTSNGMVDSDVGVARSMQAAVESGSWPTADEARQTAAADPERAPTACTENAGRFGEQDQLVPDGAVSVTLCPREEGKPRTSTEVDALVEQLNAAPTRPSDSGCTPSDPSGATDDYRLRFDYAEGRPVVVDMIFGCEPSGFGGVLQADVPVSVRKTIDQLFPPR